MGRKASLFHIYNIIYLSYPLLSSPLLSYPIHPSIYLSLCPHIYSSINLLYLFIYPSIQLSIGPSIHPSLHPSIPPSLHPSIYIYIHTYTCTCTCTYTYFCSYYIYIYVCVCVCVCLCVCACVCIFIYMLALGRLKVFLPGQSLCPNRGMHGKNHSCQVPDSNSLGQVAVKDHCKVPKEWLRTRIQAPHVVPGACWQRR